MAGLTRLLSTTTIRPASGDPNRRIDLTPSDLQCLWIEYMHIGLLFDKPKESPVEHLKATLSLALDRFYPLAGRLVSTEHDEDQKTTSFHIECSGVGATFSHAEAVGKVTVTDILDPLVPEIVGAFFPLTGVSNHQASCSNLPLLAVQVTDLVDGIFVAVSLNHCAADGTAAWEFFNIWSELSRNDEAAISGGGDFDFGRDYLNGLVDFPVRIPIRLGEAPITPVPAPPEQHRVLQFSKEKIAELKAKANAGADRDISSLQALMAHLWVCITRSQALADNELVFYLIMVSMRSRLQALPESYLGNAVHTAVAACTAGKLVERGMGSAARQISEAIANRTAMGAREFFDGCAKTCPMSPLSVAKTPPNMLITGGSPRFDVYGNDFGWGKPVLHRSHLNGNLSVAPGAEEGSIDVQAFLLPQVFEALIADPEFTMYYP